MLFILASAPRIYDVQFGLEGAAFAMFFAVHGVGIIIGQTANRRLIPVLGVVPAMLVGNAVLILSFAAGLFVDPAPGPVLANYGLDNLRFMKPVSPGDTLKVRLTAKHKTRRNDDYGEVRWDVAVTNQDGEQVAGYELLTMNAM